MNIHARGGIVTDDAALTDVCALFEKSKNIALDTEYVRESTYYPKPSLVQISNGDNHVLLDIIALKDLQPLKSLLASPKITKIIHSYEQDLMVLECINCPIKNSLFDTQLAAAFLGFGYMVGYQTLVETCLNVKLKKGYARSNWLTRPLSEEQINYALEDVVYLNELHHFLRKRLQESEKIDWFEEESKQNLDDYYTGRFERFVPKVSGEGKLMSAHEKNVLKNLAEWREEKAREANLPRRWLIKDKYLIQVVQNKISPKELIKYIDKPNIEIDIDELAKRLESTKHETHNTERLSTKDKNLIGKIKKSIVQVAKKHKIEQSLIASHKQISRFVRNRKNRTNTSLSSGWRYQIIKQPIKQLIDDNDA